MKIGDKVRHKDQNFDFVGHLIGMGVKSDGVVVCLVEQSGTRYTQSFSIHSLEVIGTTLEVYSIPKEAHEMTPPPPPPPPPEYPVKLWVPVKPVPGNSPARNKFNAEVRTYLPLKPLVSLITEDVKCEIVFHFPRSETGDIDNLTKSVLDSLKGSVIYDDKQVKELHAKYAANSLTGFNVVLTKYAP